MTLEGTIKVYEEGVSKESEQVAEWLKELKRLKEAEVAEMWVATSKLAPFSQLYREKPKCDENGMFYGSICGSAGSMFLPSLTFENSPRKVRLILED
jgi:hypothetical protein